MLGLLTGVLISQWVIDWRQQMRDAQSLTVMRSIETLLKQHSESDEQVIASMEELADAISDIHSHVEGFGSEKE